MGNGGKGYIQMVSLLNPGPKHTREEFPFIVVHEFTHVMTREFASDYRGLPRWLSEGLAAFESHQMYPERRRGVVRQVGRGTVPTFSDLNTDAVKFGNINGYPFSYTIVEFMVKEFGWEKVRELIKRPSKLKTIFGMSQTELEGRWLESLKANYAE